MSTIGRINCGRDTSARYSKKTGEAYTPKLGEVLRQQRAEERKAARDERGPAMQLRELDKRLGAGVGAKRERARLAKSIGKAAA